MLVWNKKNTNVALLNIWNAPFQKSKEDSGSDQSRALLVVKGNKTTRNILCRKMAIDETED